MGFSLIVATLATFASASPVTLHLSPGKVVRYRVAMNQKETDASGKPVMMGVTGSSQMPIQIQVLAPNSLQVTTGPLFAMGRSVGRAKVRQVSIDATGTARGTGPSWFFVTLPPGGAKTGQAWTGRMNVPAPLPAGLVATYRMNGYTPDNRFAKVSLNTSMVGATRVKGAGVLFLRASDGVLDHGNLTFGIEFIRPDLKDPKKSVVNSRVNVAVTILPS